MLKYTKIDEKIYSKKAVKAISFKSYFEKSYGTKNLHTSALCPT